MRPTLVHSVLLLCALLVVGCTGTREHYLFNVDPVRALDSQIAARHDIFIATTRARAEDDPRRVFTGARSLTASFARVEVSVPKIHQTGRIERAKGSAPDRSGKELRRSGRHRI